MNKTNIPQKETSQKQKKAKTAPYGSWQSPINASTLTKANKGLLEPQFDGNDIYWLESRPLEKGRTGIVCITEEGMQKDILPAPLNARSRVNEYGGGSYCVHEGIVYFVLFDDQRVYALNSREQETKKNITPTPLTPENPNFRFGDLTIDPIRKRLLAICEDHTQSTNKKDPPSEPKTTLVSIDIKNNNGEQPPKVIQSGEDFYSSPGISPDGTKMSWLSWNHPNMPWDGTTCWIADVNEAGEPKNIQSIAGGNSESVFQPTWSPDNNLYFSSDKNNWWNIYRCKIKTDSLTSSFKPSVELIYKDDAEYATPQWVFGLRTFGFLNNEEILTTYTKSGLWFLAKIHMSDNTLKLIPTESTDIGYVNAKTNRGIYIGSNSKEFESLYQYINVKEPKQSEDQKNNISVIQHSGSLAIDKNYLSTPEPITFPTTSNKPSDEHGHAFFYPPKNSEYQYISDTSDSNNLPPLLVFCHGGPTAAAHSSLNLKIQYWTSRGFAVVDVNYGGSTGYGREYRDRLKNNWGLVDVQDAIDCVNYLAKENKINPNKTAIRGGSAGGYTVLSALTFHDVFKAGTSLYGIGDLETLATDTHKFESRYLDQLVGPYPQAKEIYQNRSPIHYVEKLNCPALFLQGLKDKVVPPNQAEAMVAALDKQKIPVAYVTFPEEGHGFRQAENIKRALEAELYFYSKVFQFDLSDKIEPIDIKHIKFIHS